MEQEYIKEIPAGMRCIIAVAIIIITLVIGTGIYNSPANRLSRQLELGQKYLVEQNYEQAIVEFDKAITIDPMNEQAYLGKAEAYIGLNDNEKAIETYKVALGNIPESAESYLGLAEIYKETGNLKAALEITQKGYEITQNGQIKITLQEIEAELNKIVAEEERKQRQEEARKKEEEERAREEAELKEKKRLEKEKLKEEKQKQIDFYIWKVKRKFEIEEDGLSSVQYRSETDDSCEISIFIAGKTEDEDESFLLKVDKTTGKGRVVNASNSKRLDMEYDLAVSPQEQKEFETYYEEKASLKEQLSFYEEQLKEYITAYFKENNDVKSVIFEQTEKRLSGNETNCCRMRFSLKYRPNEDANHSWKYRINFDVYLDERKAELVDVINVDNIEGIDFTVTGDGMIDLQN